MLEPAPRPTDLAGSLTSVATHSPGVYAADLGSETVLYREPRLHRLNPIGSLLWGLFDGQATLGEISAEVAEAYREDLGRCARDIAAFASEMREVGLITLTSPYKVTPADA